MNDGVCSLSGTGLHRCVCTSFWTGSNCEIRINECSNETNPCGNNGVCINSIGGYNKNLISYFCINSKIIQLNNLRYLCQCNSGTYKDSNGTLCSIDVHFNNSYNFNTSETSSQTVNTTSKSIVVSSSISPLSYLKIISFKLPKF